MRTVLACLLCSCVSFKPIVQSEGKMLEDACVPRGCDMNSCGAFDDGCGNALDCGRCDAPATCGGGGIENRCGVPPEATGPVIPTELDLSVTIDDGTSAVSLGASNEYTIIVTNDGPAALDGGTLSAPLPASFLGGSWTCVPSAAASCDPATGAGSVATTISLAVGASLTVTYIATVVAPPATLSVNVGAGTLTETNVNDNSATDTDDIAPSTITNVTFLSPSNVLSRQIRQGYGAITIRIGGTGLLGASNVELLGLGAADSFSVVDASTIDATFTIPHALESELTLNVQTPINTASFPYAISVTPIVVLAGRTNGDTLGIGTYEHPYRTMTHAFTQVAAGDTVFLREGYYDASNGETFPTCASPACTTTPNVPNVPYMTIRGELPINGSSGAVLVGPSADHSPCTTIPDEAAFVVGNTSLTVQDLTIRRFMHGIVTNPSGAGGVSINTSTLEQNCRSGLRTNGRTNVGIFGSESQNTVFRQNGSDDAFDYAIDFQSGTVGDPSTMTISNTTIFSNTNGLFVGGFSQTNVSGRFSLDGHQTAIHVEDNANLDLIGSADAPIVVEGNFVNAIYSEGDVKIRNAIIRNGTFGKPTAPSLVTMAGLSTLNMVAEAGDEGVSFDLRPGSGACPGGSNVGIEDGSGMTYSVTGSEGLLSFDVCPSTHYLPPAGEYPISASPYFTFSTATNLSVIAPP